MCQESVGGVILDQERASRPVSCSPRLLRVHCVFLNFFYSNSNLNLNFQNILQLHIWMHACFQTACWKVWYHLEIFGQFGNRPEFFEIIWKYLGCLDCWSCFEIIWKYPDSFETVQKILKPSGKIQTVWKLSENFWDHLEIFGQFWNRLEDIKVIQKDQDSGETIRNVLRPSGNIWTVLKLSGNFWDHLEIAKQFWTVLKISSRKIRTMVKPSRMFWDHQEIFEQFWNCLEFSQIIWKYPNSFETVWTAFK